MAVDNDNNKKVTNSYNNHTHHINNSVWYYIFIAQLLSVGTWRTAVWNAIQNMWFLLDIDELKMAHSSFQENKLHFSIKTGFPSLVSFIVLC